MALGPAPRLRHHQGKDSMRVLVVGATGKVGHATTRALLAAGHEVRALVRNPARAPQLLPRQVEMMMGDVTDPASLVPAATGCRVVFNAMGIPEQWLARVTDFERINARGTENVVRAAREAGVARVVHTSTIDVFHAESGARFDESAVADYPKGTAYERSKQHAEELASAAAGDMELVFVNPAAVYGPGPPGTASLERNLFEPIVRGRLPGLVAGGLALVYSDGVGAGQLLAAERGRPNERYILCDEHLSLRRLAETVVRIAGRGRVPPTIPVPLAHLLAATGEMIARVTGRPPLLARGGLRFLMWNAVPDSAKAQRELGWRPTPFEEGLRRTLAGLGLVESERPRL
jgi:nucleoside-diphosphate-sugar epimerase